MLEEIITASIIDLFLKDCIICFSKLSNQVIDNPISFVLNYLCGPQYVLIMHKEEPQKQNEALIKFLSPVKLKLALLKLASERNITLSSLRRFWG
jgi:hypothetical protein